MSQATTHRVFTLQCRPGVQSPEFCRPHLECRRFPRARPSPWHRSFCEAADHLRRSQHDRRASRLKAVCAAAKNAEARPATTAQHSVVALLDATPYLSDGSKQALATAAKSAQTSSSKVTVVLINGTSLADEDRKKRLDTIVWHFQQAEFSNFEVLEKQAETASVTIGDVADEVKADLLIMSVEPVHAKIVDANLLAEFVPCPMLLLP
ncbi:hypothetical protein ABBQ38_006779 [Trebouxia sp. C0009 RCD-2024]